MPRKPATVWVCLALWGAPAAALADGEIASVDSPAYQPRQTASAGDESAEISSRFGPRFVTQTSDHFTLIYPADQSPAEAQKQAVQTLEATFVSFYQSMEAAGFRLQPLTGRLTWASFATTDQFSRYALETDRMNLAWLDGYYSARTNRVAMKHLTTDRATHEAAHQLAFNSGLQTRGVMYPLWVSEGLATSFETDGSHPSGPGSDNAVRRARLAEAKAANRLRPLGEFLTLTRVPGDDYTAASDLYAQSWGVFSFLFNHHRNELRQYLAALSRVHAGRRDTETLIAEIENAFGPTQPLTHAWDEFLTESTSSPPLTNQVAVLPASQ